jgi:hypothetical protein
MKFTIREMLLITLVAAVLLGWYAYHRRMVARDAAWEKAFERLANELTTASETIPREFGIDTPNGPWRIWQKPVLPLPPGAAR